MTDNADSRKSCTFRGIQANYLKGASNISVKFLHIFWNVEVLKALKFSSELKLEHFAPDFKKENATLVENYRPISLSPIICNIFERIMLDKITNYMNVYLSPYLCGYGNCFNTQAAFSSLIEKWKWIIDNKGYGAAILRPLLVESSVIVQRTHL